jgi:hypothetical protein
MQSPNGNTMESSQPGTAPADGQPVLTAFRIPEHYTSFLKIVPAPADRHWMDFGTRGWANRCLPLRVANQAGWHILNDCDFEAEWRGKDELDSVRISFKPGNSSQFVKSSFGYGILTWYLPYLFRTPPGYNLLVRGPANSFKDGIAPLDGLVETDWAVATFSVNWRFTRPFHKVTFERDEPICTILPQRRGELESFAPEVRNLDGEPLAEFQHWLGSRQQFEKDKQGHGKQHEGHYTRGETVAGNKALEHQTKLALASFVEREPPRARPASSEVAPEVRGGTGVDGALGRWIGRYLGGRRAK